MDFFLKTQQEQNKSVVNKIARDKSMVDKSREKVYREDKNEEM